MKKLCVQFLAVWKWIFDPSYRLMSQNLKRISNEVRHLNSETEIILVLGNGPESDSSLLSQMIEQMDHEPDNIFNLPHVYRANPTSRSAIESFFAEMPRGLPIRTLILSENALWIAGILPKSIPILGIAHGGSKEPFSIARISHRLIVPSIEFAGLMMDELEANLPIANHPKIVVAEACKGFLTKQIKATRVVEFPPIEFREIDSFASAATILRHPSVRRMLPEIDAEIHDSRLILMQGKKHLNIRKLIQPLFTPKAMAALNGQIDKIVRHHFEQYSVEDFDEFDLKLSRPMTLEILANFIGIESSEIEAIDKLIEKRIRRVHPNYPNNNISDTIFFWELHKRIPLWFRTCPSEEVNLIRTLKAHVDSNEDISMDIRNLIVSTLTAGLGTVRHFINQIKDYLVNNPQDFRSIQQNPNLIAPFIEEMLRFMPIAEHIWLTTLEDIEIDGISFASGEVIRVNIQKANREPMVFDHPDEVNWNRPRIQHLTFGIGAHHCLGSWFVRKQTEVWLEHLLHSSRELQK